MTYEEFVKFLADNRTMKLYDVPYNSSFELWKDAVIANTQETYSGATCEFLTYLINRAIKLFGEDVINDFKQFYNDNTDQL